MRKAKMEPEDESSAGSGAAPLIVFPYSRMGVMTTAKTIAPIMEMAMA